MMITYNTVQMVQWVILYWLTITINNSMNGVNSLGIAINNN